MSTMELSQIQRLIKPSDTKIVLLVPDGLGGLPNETDGRTALEAADTPNLDELAGRSMCGLIEPVGPGITPGSGPEHLALFGYDPLLYQIGRGVLTALGVGFDLKPQDVAARGNFCTVDEEGIVTDRRAGRLPTEQNEKLCARLQEIDLPEIAVFVRTVKEHRFLLVLRGDGLSGEVTDTDPQETGREPREPKGRSAEGEPTAQLVAEFVRRAREQLSGEDRANMILLRGFAKEPDWPQI